MNNPYLIFLSLSCVFTMQGMLKSKLHEVQVVVHGAKRFYEVDENELVNPVRFTRQRVMLDGPSVSSITYRPQDNTYLIEHNGIIDWDPKKPGLADSSFIVDDAIADNITLLSHSLDVIYRTKHGEIIARDPITGTYLYSFLLPRVAGEKSEELLQCRRMHEDRILVIERNGSMYSWSHQEVKSAVALARKDFIKNRLARELGLKDTRELHE